MASQPRLWSAFIGPGVFVGVLLAMAAPAAASTDSDTAAPCRVVCVIGKNVCQVDSTLTPLVNQAACLIGGVLIFIDSEIPFGT